MKSRLIVNPRAGSDSAPDCLAMVNERLRAGVGALTIAMTVGEGGGVKAAREAVEDGCDQIFIGGGDGTVNEVLNGVAGVADALASVSFGVIPLGTANDLAAALGIPPGVEEAIEALLTGEPRPVDVGRVNDTCFVNVSGGGFMSDVSDAVDPMLKTIAGRVAYLVAGARLLMDSEPVRVRLRYARRPPPREGGSPGGPFFADPPDAANLHAFAVCNARLMGGRPIAPHAVLDDGLLDVCLIHAMPTMEFVAVLRRVVDGEHVRDERVSYFQTSELDLEFDRVINVDADGQVFQADKCSYRILPHAARFLAPARHRSPQGPDTGP